jgi:hypothetical protein
MHTEEPLRYAVEEFVRKLRAEELDIEGWTLQRLWEEGLGQDGRVNIFDLSTELDHKGLALIVADLTNPETAFHITPRGWTSVPRDSILDD